MPEYEDKGDPLTIYRANGSHSFLEKEIFSTSSYEKMMEILIHSVIADPAELNRCMRYYAKLEKYHMEEKKKVFATWLIGKRAVGGQQWNDFLMALARIWVKEGGRNMSNKQLYDIMRLQAKRPTAVASDQNNGHKEEGDNI